MGNNAPNPTARILNISFSSGNQMNMDMKYRLTCVFASIYPDIKACN